MTGAERKRNARKRRAQGKLENIAVLDFETDPFDNDHPDKIIAPFLAVLYSDNFEPIVIWDDDSEKLIDAVLAAIVGLPDQYTIYAHNGGKFDFMFFVHKLRGEVLFKGRGIMSCQVGAHELRDSFHIIPEALSNWQKDKFDYRLLAIAVRHKHREPIIRYCTNDCRYLLEIVKRFVDQFGFKITIGQAAMSVLKTFYKPQPLSPFSDEYLRDRYYFGGRVECLQGRGQWNGEYKLYDVNSMYPYVMASYRHPLGNDFTRRPGIPSNQTAFIHLRCKNRGALINRMDSGETTANTREGEFYTTIMEYGVACRYNLISDVEIIDCIDWTETTDFSKFVLPLYETRQKLKLQMEPLKKAGLENSSDYKELQKDDMIMKYVLNNAYGKFAQNPRNYKEHYLTGPNDAPPDWWFDSLSTLTEDDQARARLPSFYNDQYAIWERPNPTRHFNNVATAASITGAARATLLEAIQNAVDPLYCDTDSIICRSLSGVEIDPAKLGAWKLEREFSDVMVCGKKLYATKVKGLEYGQRQALKVKSKGTSFLRLGELDTPATIYAKQETAWSEMGRILAGETIAKRQFGATLTRYGEQFYMTRNIRATANVLTFSCGVTQAARFVCGAMKQASYCYGVTR